MKKASITEVKDRLSAMIDGLKGGRSVLIVDRDRPVARLEPVGVADKVDAEGRRARLVRDGALRPGRGAASPEILSGPLPRLKPGASAVAALIDERREGR